MVKSYMENMNNILTSIPKHRKNTFDEYISEYRKNVNKYVPRGKVFFDLCSLEAEKAWREL